MLLDWIIGPMLSFCTTVLGYLPQDNSVQNWFNTHDADIVPAVGSVMSTVGYFVPISLAAQIVQITLVYILPAVCIFEVAQWGYREIPEIAGFSS